MCLFERKPKQSLEYMYMYMYFPFVFSFSFFSREKKQQNYHGRKSVTMIGSITNLMSSLESDLTWEAEVSDSDPSPLRASAISITPRSLLHYE